MRRLRLPRWVLTLRGSLIFLWAVTGTAAVIDGSWYGYVFLGLALLNVVTLYIAEPMPPKPDQENKKLVLDLFNALVRHARQNTFNPGDAAVLREARDRFDFTVTDFVVDDWLKDGE